jgi:hypothetical protein
MVIAEIIIGKSKVIGIKIDMRVGEEEIEMKKISIEVDTIVGRKEVEVKRDPTKEAEVRIANIIVVGDREALTSISVEIPRNETALQTLPHHLHLHQTALLKEKRKLFKRKHFILSNYTFKLINFIVFTHISKGREMEKTQMRQRNFGMDSNG